MSKPTNGINRDGGVLSHPTLAVLLFPYTPELLNKLNSKLLLAEVATRLDNHRQAVPIGFMNDIRNQQAGRIDGDMPR
jgi:hypothetical protein